MKRIMILDKRQIKTVSELSQDEITANLEKVYEMNNFMTGDSEDVSWISQRLVFCPENFDSLSVAEDQDFFNSVYDYFNLLTD